MTVAEFSVEVDAPPERVWDVVSDPRNLPHWDRHIASVSVPSEGMSVGTTYEVVMRFMGVRTVVRAHVLEWEEPWRARLRLMGVIDATVTSAIASLPFDRSVLRHEVDYRFRGPLGGFAAASVNAVGGAHLALRHGTLAQKREIERARP